MDRPTPSLKMVAAALSARTHTVLRNRGLHCLECPYIASQVLKLFVKLDLKLEFCVITQNTFFLSFPTTLEVEIES